MRAAQLVRQGATLAIVLVLLAVFCGCSTARQQFPSTGRPFAFYQDTFAYANELVWEYGYEASGHWAGHRRDPEPGYSHHCVVVARSALQFFVHARFDPSQPVADEATYRRLIRRVVKADPRKNSAEAQKIVIPGYADLRQFSHAQEQLLKAECGGPLESYFQRGNWRMVFPFSRCQQVEVASQLLAWIDGGRIAVVHIVRFPSLTINHAVLVFDAEPTATEIRFLAYDPNDPEKPVELTYGLSDRTFRFAANQYFPGGRVDVYQMYHHWAY